ncbi:hypothetical protein [Iodobacter fluviatilis]|uniref:Uncharacterized protein n=1 Tax=Iodobacter fluviatilis TaxID=537 RepID=A0A7G3G970_9NEIS|nr:hypothetical protein [Iodobacter fluviatilis]QBC43719.1 hypothetical protein C1H71_09280 [Iodobacter fluviatilis]
MNLIVTDFTKMKDNKICLAGIDLESKLLIRPLPYIYTPWALDRGISPGSILKGEWWPKESLLAPHLEDCSYKNLEVDLIYRSVDLFSVLSEICSNSIVEGFGGIVAGSKKMSNTSLVKTSIVTIKINARCSSLSSDSEGKIRVDIKDGAGDLYCDLSLTDYNLLSKLNFDKKQIESFNESIRISNNVNCTGFRGGSNS